MMAVRGRVAVLVAVALLIVGFGGIGFGPEQAVAAPMAAASPFAFNQAPVAAFRYMPEAPIAGQSVTFDAGDSYDPDGSIVDYRWDFTGDGTWDAAGVTAAWAFGEAGAHSVTLFVVDNNDTVARVTRNINVGTLSVAPTEARFTYAPERPRPGQLVTFDGAASVFASAPVRYEWDLDGDGLFEATGPIVSRRYDRDGIYRVTLRISDSFGRMATLTRVVQVGRGLVSVVLESEPSDLQVFIDGAARGRTPLTLELEPGRHRLRVRHTWRGEWETELDLRYIEELTLRIVLR